jgi:antitoxin (DNA-binding transcriptional repressor) of toxin-antitoxin stability system
MKSISIRELHMHTGKWVREAAVSHESLIVLDRGRPVARLLPLEDVTRTPFSERIEVVGFDQLPETGTDSGRLLEEDRR